MQNRAEMNCLKCLKGMIDSILTYYILLNLLGGLSCSTIEPLSPGSYYLYYSPVSFQ